MPPADSKILGNATIWNRDDEEGEGGEGDSVTSKLYPVELADSMSVAGSISDLYLQTVIKNVYLEEELTIAGGISQVFLDSKVIYSTYDYEEANSVHVDGEITGVFLEPQLIYSTYEYTEENDIHVEGGVSQVFLEQVVAYIYYDYDVEYIDISGGITGVTLTTI